MSLLKSTPLYERNIPLAFNRVVLNPPIDSTHLSTGTYSFSVFSDRVEHELFAGLPNPQGGFSVAGSLQEAGYLVWLRDGHDTSSGYTKLGEAKRRQDGMYYMKISDSKINPTAKYKHIVISYEKDTSVSFPAVILLSGKLPRC